MRGEMQQIVALIMRLFNLMTTNFRLCFYQHFSSYCTGSKNTIPDKMNVQNISSIYYVIHSVCSFNECIRFTIFIFFLIFCNNL